MQFLHFEMHPQLIALQRILHQKQCTKPFYLTLQRTIEYSEWIERVSYSIPLCVYIYLYIYTAIRVSCWMGVLSFLSYWLTSCVVALFSCLTWFGFWLSLSLLVVGYLTVCTHSFAKGRELTTLAFVYLFLGI